MAPEPHRDLQPLASLLGTWRGESMGEHPTIDPFSYMEELTFERGFLRPGEAGRIGFTLAHPIGLTTTAGSVATRSTAT